MKIALVVTWIRIRIQFLIDSLKTEGLDGIWLKLANFFVSH